MGAQAATPLGLWASTKSWLPTSVTTLGEYLVGSEGLDLASQLPQRLAEHLRQQPPNRPMVYSFPDFLQQIGEH